MGIVNSKFIYSTTGTAALAAAVLYFYFFRPSSERRANSNRSLVLGLKNFGYTCYLNAILQALASCDQFVEWIRINNEISSGSVVENQISQSNGVPGMFKSNSSTKCILNRAAFPIVAILHKSFVLINRVLRGDDELNSSEVPGELMKVFNQVLDDKYKSEKRNGHKFRLIDTEEQDTHEVFNHLMSNLSDEFGSEVKKSYERSIKYLMSHQETESSGNVANGITGGRVANKQCAICDKTDKGKVLLECSQCYKILHRRCMELSNLEWKIDSLPWLCPSCRDSKDLSQNKPGQFGDGVNVKGVKVTVSENHFEIEMSTGHPPISSGAPSSTQQPYRRYSKRDSNRNLIHTKVDRVSLAHAKVEMALSNSFQGTAGSQLQCISCFSRRDIHIETFSSISLNLPPRGANNIVTIYDLLDAYTKPIIVHSVDCDSCTKKLGRTTKSSFYRMSAFAKLPPTLCIHILRTEWNRDGSSYKRKEHVRFPVGLNLTDTLRVNDIINREARKKRSERKKSRRMSDNGGFLESTSRFKNSQYSLRSIVSHRGDVDSGHFVTYRRSPKNEFGETVWLLVSDMIVMPVTLEEVLSAKAYMLFYEKVNTPTSDEAPAAAAPVTTN